MAYTEQQRRIVAMEVARSGGNLAAARKRLRDEYETFRTVGENTLRRFMREKGFAELVAEQAALLVEAEKQAATEVERERVRRELEGSVVDRLARDERLLDEARSRLEEVLKDPSRVDPKLSVWAFESLAKIIDKRHASLVPTVAETKQATWLVESVMEAAVEEFGHARAKRLMTRVRERYEERVKRAEQPDAPAG